MQPGTTLYPRHARLQYWHYFVCTALALLLLALISLGTGVQTIPPATTWNALFAFDPANSDHLLVRQLRLPRTLAAILVGAALACAGAIMQALTRNPLADPGILGVSAGASTAIAGGIALFGVSGIGWQLGFGMFGAALAGLGILLLGSLKLGGDPVRIVLAGTALTAILLSLTQIITLNSDEQVFDQFRHWSVGSLQGRDLGVLLPLTPAILLGLLAAFALSRALDALVLGDELGSSLGANPRRTWLFSAAAVILLAGSATAAAGPIAFIGLTAPHLARFMVGPGHRRLLPATVLTGALLMLLADTLGRCIARPGEISVGVMIALIGGPFFVALARRRSLAQL